MGWKQEAAVAAEKAIQRPLLTLEDDDIPELDILELTTYYISTFAVSQTTYGRRLQIGLH